MKKPIILWFAENKTKYQTIIEKLKSERIVCIISSDWNEFISLLYKKDIAISIVEHTCILKNKLDPSSVNKILSISKVHSQIIIGKESDLEIGKDNDVDTIINPRTNIDTFTSELTSYWGAFQILSESQGQFENLSSHESVEDMLKNDLTLKDRKISSLYSQLIETQNKTRLLYTEWKKTNIPIKTKRLYDFDFKFKNAIKEQNADWEEFHDHFVMIHPNFFKNLINKHTGLSEENQKMCAYIKMGLSNKQIANYLNILPNSVKRAQTRIKNKMNLPLKVTLRKHINSDIG